MRLVALLPRFVRLWSRATEYRTQGDWLALERTMQELASNGWSTDESNLLYGHALLQLGQWQEALDRLNAIEAPLGDISNEAVRWTSSAIALRNLGRISESQLLIQSRLADDWPQEEKDRAALILEADDC